MKHRSPQFELPGADQVFCLAGETAPDWSKVKREAQQTQEDKRRAEQAQIALPFGQEVGK